MKDKFSFLIFSRLLGTFSGIVLGGCAILLTYKIAAMLYGFNESQAILNLTDFALFAAQQYAILLSLLVLIGLLFVPMSFHVLFYSLSFLAIMLGHQLFTPIIENQALQAIKTSEPRLISYQCNDAQCVVDAIAVRDNEKEYTLSFVPNQTRYHQWLIGAKLSIQANQQAIITNNPQITQRFLLLKPMLEKQLFEKQRIEKLPDTPAQPIQ